LNSKTDQFLVKCPRYAELSILPCENVRVMIA
jgi:hypothetical protein